MKKLLKIIIAIICVAGITIAGVFSPYMLSFVFTNDELVISDTEPSKIKITSEPSEYHLDSSLTGFGMFNYYGLKYKADAYVKGILTYKTGLTETSEEFFLEPSDSEKEFYSFIDGSLQYKKGYKPVSLSFQALDKNEAVLTIGGFSVFNRAVPEQDIYIEADNLKLGIDLLWGGALCYLEDTDSNVQVVNVDGKIKVDSNAGDRYNAEVVNENVNLINRNDTGRLVQQSYYGTLEYDHGVYMDNDWRYNPVQGGNQFNDASKIIDLRITDNSVYVKCRPLDWAKEKEYITPSYMEAIYSIEDGLVHTKCRFVDFSGYPEAESSQEIPAFYCIEPLDNFVYYKGDEPWTNGELTYEKDLIFWPDAGYPHFYSKENWAAFTGEFEDSFGIGLFVPDEEEFLTGIFSRGNTVKEDPSTDSPTSYIAVTKTRTFRSFEPYEYEYYLATGDVQEIRGAFSTIK